MKESILRGNLYYADLSPVVGSEQGGNRPVLIIQNNIGNKHSPTIIIAPLTSKLGVKPRLPTHYYIDTQKGLDHPSIVLLEQLRTIDKIRLGNYIGRLDEKHIKGINNAIAISVGLFEQISSEKSNNS
ncbi:MAG: type II toxin-antitoxin system PemK/MazF family toxin [Eubacteriales bacterium]|nr:type II toxin-antitoxin system PemK/MazF family toxin [Eubacteriales bacterium]